MDTSNKSCHNCRIAGPKIFVSGFTRHTTTAQVAAYFSVFGSTCVEKYDSYFKRHQTGARYKGGEGYFILRDLHPDTYQHILESCPHMAGRRCLEVCPLKTGLDLILYNSLKNKRRVLVKKVPGTVTDQRLVATLVRRFGPVERFFSYKSDTRSKHLHANKAIFRTVSVTFQSRAAALQACSAKSVVIRTETEQVAVALEKFKRTKVALRQPTESAVDDGVPEMPACKSTSSQASFVLAEDQRRRESRRRFDLLAISGTTNTSIPSVDNAFGEAASQRQFGERLSSRGEAQSADSRPNDLCSERAVLAQHHIKPNSKGYRHRISNREMPGNLEFRWTVGRTDVPSTHRLPPYKVERNATLSYLQ